MHTQLYGFVGRFMMGSSGHIAIWRPRVKHSVTTKTQQQPRAVSQKRSRGFSGGSVVKNPPTNAGDRGLIPGLGRSYMLRSN